MDPSVLRAHVRRLPPHCAAKMPHARGRQHLPIDRRAADVHAIAWQAVAALAVGGNAAEVQRRGRRACRRGTPPHTSATSPPRPTELSTMSNQATGSVDSGWMAWKVVYCVSPQARLPPRRTQAGPPLLVPARLHFAADGHDAVPLVLDRGHACAAPLGLIGQRRERGARRSGATRNPAADQLRASEVAIAAERTALGAAGRRDGEIERPVVALASDLEDRNPVGRRIHPELQISVRRSTVKERPVVGVAVP